MLVGSILRLVPCLAAVFPVRAEAFLAFDDESRSIVRTSDRRTVALYELRCASPYAKMCLAVEPAVAAAAPTTATDADVAAATAALVTAAVAAVVTTAIVVLWLLLLLLLLLMLMPLPPPPPLLSFPLLLLLQYCCFLYGLSSPLPLKGLELVNPNADKEKKVMQANKKWFDSSSGFMSAKPK